jgi:hypothetical protein
MLRFTLSHMHAAFFSVLDGLLLLLLLLLLPLLLLLLLLLQVLLAPPALQAPCRLSHPAPTTPLIVMINIAICYKMACLCKPPCSCCCCCCCFRCCQLPLPCEPPAASLTQPRQTPLLL